MKVNDISINDVSVLVDSTTRLAVIIKEGLRKTGRIP